MTWRELPSSHRGQGTVGEPDSLWTMDGFYIAIRVARLPGRDGRGGTPAGSRFGPYGIRSDVVG